MKLLIQSGLMFVVFSILSLTCYGFEIQKPKVYQGTETISDWVMSEKLDGIRGYWDGQRIRTRNGNPIHAPEWFLENFPDFPLDGELWSDRNQFTFIQATVLDESPGPDWNHINFNIFEVPNATGDFLTRLGKAESWFTNHGNNHVRIIPQIVCKDRDHLQTFLEEVESQGGEGVVIKDPSLPYHSGRSSSVLKVKSFKDMEGTVIAINRGNGKYADMMGSLTIEMADGKVFKLGTGFSDETRKNPPPVGSVVTYKYYGFTKNGLPRFASFLRIRKD